MRRCLLGISILVLAFMANGCDNNTGNTLHEIPSHGSLSVKINWPASSDTNRMIPSDTAQITITATQYGAQKGTTVIQRPQSFGTISNLPTGYIAVSALARSAQGAILANGTTMAQIQDGVNASVSIVLNTGSTGGDGIPYADAQSQRYERSIPRI